MTEPIYTFLFFLGISGIILGTWGLASTARKSSALIEDMLDTIESHLPIFRGVEELVDELNKRKKLTKAEKKAIENIREAFAAARSCTKSKIRKY